jgi:PAS domain-containing protein
MQKPSLDISFTSSDTFREIFQSAAEGILMVDGHGKIQLANPYRNVCLAMGRGS